MSICWVRQAEAIWSPRHLFCVGNRCTVRGSEWNTCCLWYDQADLLAGCPRGGCPSLNLTLQGQAFFLGNEAQSHEGPSWVSQEVSLGISCLQLNVDLQKGKKKYHFHWPNCFFLPGASRREECSVYWKTSNISIFTCYVLLLQGHQIIWKAWRLAKQFPLFILHPNMWNIIVGQLNGGTTNHGSLHLYSIFCLVFLESKG